MSGDIGDSAMLKDGGESGPVGDIHDGLEVEVVRSDDCVCSILVYE